MPSKSASAKYKFTKGNLSHRRKIGINYQFARGFSKFSLVKKFKKHAASMGIKTMEEYEKKAVAFANKVDEDNLMFIDQSKKSTYRYNPKTNEFAIISKEGFVVNYFKPSQGLDYFLRQKKLHGKKKKGKK